MLCRFEALSDALRGAGLRVRRMWVFSCPEGASSAEDDGVEGIELPEVETWLKARLDGLLGDVLGDVRWRERGLFKLEVEAGLFVDLAERKDNFALGRKGVARGD